MVSQQPPRSNGLDTVLAIVTIIPGTMYAFFFILFIGAHLSWPIEWKLGPTLLFISAIALVYALWRPFPGGLILFILALVFGVPQLLQGSGGAELFLPFILFGLLSIIRGVRARSTLNVGPAIRWTLSVLGLVVAVAVLIYVGQFFASLSPVMSKWHPTAGANGSFEVARGGIPVNWEVGPKKSLKNGDVELMLDPLDPLEGRQSLKLVAPPGVHTEIPWWGPPGIMRMFSVSAGHTYKISYHLKWKSGRVKVWFSSREGENGASDGGERSYGEAEMGAGTWQRFEHLYPVPATHKDYITFGLALTGPGTIWVDDVRIEEVQESQ